MIFILSLFSLFFVSVIHAAGGDPNSVQLCNCPYYQVCDSISGACIPAYCLTNSECASAPCYSAYCNSGVCDQSALITCANNTRCDLISGCPSISPAPTITPTIVNTTTCIGNFLVCEPGQIQCCRFPSYCAPGVCSGSLPGLCIPGGSECGPGTTCDGEDNCVVTQAPTSQPTDIPTLQFTSQPTDIPTSEPTTQPTDFPTSSPTSSAPTFIPTTRPTDSPTPSPTGSPTRSPTHSPTRSPTRSPTSDDNDDQGQNGNGKGQNGNGQGQNGNGQNQNGNGQGQNGNGQNQNGNNHLINTDDTGAIILAVIGLFALVALFFLSLYMMYNSRVNVGGPHAKVI